MGLTTLAKVKQYGSIAEFESDTLLLRFIEAASTMIENYCSRRFLSQQYTEVRDGTGGNRMTMRNLPVIAVSSVTVNGRSINNRLTPTGSGYSFNDLSVRLSGQVFESGVDNVTIVYTAGMATVPADVDAACCEMVCLRYKSRDWLGVDSKGLAGESISFNADDIPERVSRVLDQYRTVGLQ